ncbi:MAG: hypothetical protein WCH20_10250 [Nitrospira sp.]
MNLKQQIFNLLEPEEQERLIPLEDREKFEQQCDQVGSRIVLPVFKRIQKDFRSYGRSVDITPDHFPIFPPVDPRLRIAVPDGRAFTYWVEIKRSGDKFWVAHHHLIEGDKKSCISELWPQGKQQFVDDLSEVRQEDIQQNFIELYQEHITMKKMFRRHAR